jgi:hypothetical protein
MIDLKRVGVAFHFKFLHLALYMFHKSRRSVCLNQMNTKEGRTFLF